MQEYLTDYPFLQELINEKLSEQFIKIIILNWAEKPVKEIQGRATGGSLSFNGNSSVRRTGNLSMCIEEGSEQITNLQSLFSINKKIKIEVGLLNTTLDYTKEEILWFPLGVYVISNPSISHGTNGLNLSLSLKDKMALLNGDCGGILPAPIAFHEVERLNPQTGDYIIEQPTVVQIIRELVNHWGGEQLGKIIISDLDTRVKKVVKWVGSSPLYYSEDTSENGKAIQYHFATSEDELPEGAEVQVYQSGEDVGYMNTDFVFPGELNGNAGESVCTILDKIKNTLGNFEYFYDVHGNFIFQEIKNYLNTSQSTVALSDINNSNYLKDKGKGNVSFSFTEADIITSFVNNPQFNMIKNDFVVWGAREDSEGNKWPIRFHLVIDNKPKIGNTYKCCFYADEYDEIRKAKPLIEINNETQLPNPGEVDRFYLIGNQIYTWSTKETRYIVINEPVQNITSTDWRTELYLSGAVSNNYGLDTNYYYTELANEWPKLYDIEAGQFYPDVEQTPSDIDFFLDFIDSGAAISELSVSNIGRRTKVINDDKINCMFEPKIPNIYIIENEQDKEKVNALITECDYKGQNWVLVGSNIFSRLALGGASNSAYYAIQDLLYQHTSYNETVSIQARPLYFLEPNIRIALKDNDSGIFGDYIITSISLPLTSNGTMSISCTRALDKI